MDKVEIKISREVLDILADLPAILEQLGYKYTLALGEKLVDEIVDFIYSLPNRQCYSIPEEYEYHFVRYGNPKFYAFFKRKSSTITWYIFFYFLQADRFP